VTACHIHGRTHNRRARPVLLAARANPLTRCWRCGKTLADHAPHKNGKPASWNAGHTRDIDCQLCGHTHGDPHGPLAPEASTCNTIAGGDLTQGKSNRLVAMW
jgi:hypothetical protein